LESDQHESCRAQQIEQLLFWEFFKLLWKIKSNFGISVLVKFKIGIFPKWEFEFQTVLVKFTWFLSEFEFEP